MDAAGASSNYSPKGLFAKKKKKKKDSLLILYFLGYPMIKDHGVQNH